MFVIVHQHDAVGLPGNGSVVEILVARLNADIQLHALGVQVGGKLGQQLQITWLGTLGEGFKVHHQTTVLICCQQ